MNRCPLCPGVNNCVESDGLMQKGGILLVGEAPGKDEDKKKIPFIGKTGTELNQNYLKLAGLHRGAVRITNSIRCLPTSAKGKLDPKRTADLDMLYSCAECHLYPEIEQMKPKVIVAMGTFACKALDPSIDLEMQHGIPCETSFGTVFPMYHPALGIHAPKSMLMLSNDWRRLGKLRLGQLHVPQDEYPETDYRVADTNLVHEDLQGCTDQPIACDTENFRDGKPFCLTYSVRPGTGRLIMWNDYAALEVFQQYMDIWEAEILWHFWLHDYKVTRQMGLKFNKNRIVDTILPVYHLGNLPQGLKALARRELGVGMKDFDDVVTQASKDLVLDFYRDAWQLDWPKPEEQMVRDKDGELKLYKPQSFRTKLKRFWTDYSKAPDTKDVFEMWTKNWEDVQGMVEERIGRQWPGKCISYAPFDEVLWYACRDSDVLLRLWPTLKRRRSLVRKLPQYKWEEAA